MFVPNFCRIHCTGTGSYSSAEVIRSSYPGVMYDKIKLSGFKVQDVSPGVVGRFFIEVFFYVLCT